MEYLINGLIVVLLLIFIQAFSQSSTPKKQAFEKYSLTALLLFCKVYLKQFIDR